MPGSNQKDKQWTQFSFSGRMPTERPPGPKQRRIPHWTPQTPCCWQKRTQPQTPALCCEGTNGPTRSCLHLLESKASERPGDNLCCPSPLPSPPFSLQHDLLPAQGTGCNKQVGLLKISWKGVGPHRSPCFPFPDPGPFAQNTSLFSAVCHLIPSKEDVTLQRGVCICFSRSFCELMKEKAFNNSTPKVIKRRGTGDGMGTERACSTSLKSNHAPC